MKRTALILILALVFSAGCASESKKLSEDALLSSEAFDQLNIIREAYENRNESEIRRLASPIAEEVSGQLLFSRAELSFEKRLVRISQDRITVHATWRGSWWFDSSEPVASRGVADFVLERETLTLIRVDGDNPFTAPGAIR